MMKKLTIPEFVEIKKKFVENHLSNYVETAAGCWEYQGSCTPEGYGKIRTSIGDGSRAKYGYRLHRISYYYHNHTDPASLVVRHDCDNPCCINPAHLRLGTVLDNNRDCMERGRIAKGEKVGTSKLTNECVINIKKRLREGKETQTKIAKDFGVRAQTINHIHVGRYWNHIQLPSKPLTKEPHQFTLTL